MKNALIGIIFTLLLCSCGTTKIVRPDSITLAEALKDIVTALNEMSKVQSEKKLGLIPADVTVTFNISASSKKTAGASIEIVPTGIINEIPKIGGSYEKEISGTRGNQIVIKFRNIMFATEKELISRKTPSEIDELFDRLEKGGWFIKSLDY